MRPDRRRHIVYITRNTEYHCRDRECVGVRDRQSGVWRREHPAVRAELVGGFHPGSRTPGDPEAGVRLVFSGAAVVMTSRVLFAGRPDRDSVFFYTSRCRAGQVNC
jgi:hypothetical protein